MIDYDILFSNSFRSLKGNIIRELYKWTNQPGFISFAGGNPDPSTFPNEALAELTRKNLLEKGTQCLQYGVSNGVVPLREYVAEMLTSEGVPTKVENVVITTGSRRPWICWPMRSPTPATSFCGKPHLWWRRLKIFSIYGANIIPVDADDDGMLPESLEEKLSAGPVKLIYMIPNFQNPTGITLPYERRRKIMEIVRRHNVLVIEDDPYGKAPLCGRDRPAHEEHGQRGPGGLPRLVLQDYCAGLRVAFAVCNEKIAQKIVLAKQNNDMHTPNLNQFIVNDYCRNGMLEPHIAECCALYAKKRGCMLEMLDKYFPQSMKWTRPEGGMFLWSELPEGYSSMRLLNYVLPARVAYVPGDSFFADGRGVGTMRMNFANASLDTIEPGIKLLGEQIQRYFDGEKVETVIQM